jgi:hypothetical protein
LPLAQKEKEDMQDLLCFGIIILIENKKLHILRERESRLDTVGAGE